MFRINIAFVFMIALLSVKHGMGNPLSTPAADSVTENNAELVSSIKGERDVQEYSPGSVTNKEERATTSAAISPKISTPATALSTSNDDGTLTVTKFNGHGFKQTLGNLFGITTRRLRHV
ncbi:hypothetical protein KXD40_008739 [Peronospora effusa]|nr:hypothetical protein KXD40_008739 [Peronospora effusa]CAI5700797.1 unnamed protein product [Peronospora effusa]